MKISGELQLLPGSVVFWLEALVKRGYFADLGRLYVFRYLLAQTRVGRDHFRIDDEADMKCQMLKRRWDAMLDVLHGH